MLAGEWFHPNDAELEQDRTRARHLTHRLNVTLKDKDATYLATLRELCPGVEAMIRAPFYCDYGYNISIGKGSYVNFNCVFLDLGPIRLGQRCLIGPGVQLLTAVHPMDATERATGKRKRSGHRDRRRLLAGRRRDRLSRRQDRLPLRHRRRQRGHARHSRQFGRCRQSGPRYPHRNRRINPPLRKIALGILQQLPPQPVVCIQKTAIRDLFIRIFS